MGPIAAGFLMAGVNMLGNAFGSTQQQNQNMELAKYQRQADMRMLRYQNRYNSPQAQMARYEKAGLNPNLMYGQGTPGNMLSVPRHSPRS